MSVAKGKMEFYGIDNINEKLDVIIKPLNVEKYYFEIKLIIVEAINNAFIHGNNGDKDKPIYVQWELKDKVLIVSVTDCGDGVKGIINQKEINEHNILDESGRGLYIISSYTDELNVEGNSIIMKKNLL